MGEVLSIFGSKKNMPPMDVEREAREQAEDAARAKMLKEYLDQLTWEDALQVREDLPVEPDMPMPEDLDRVVFEDVKTMSPRVAERCIRDGILSDFQRRHVEVSLERQRALNNLVQLKESGRFVSRPAAISIGGGSAETLKIQDQIQGEKIQLLEELLGADISQTVDELQANLEAGWKSEEWQDELTQKLRAIELDEGNNPQRFLAAAEMVTRSDNPWTREGAIHLGTVREKIDRLKRLEAAREALQKGDPGSIKHHPENRDLEYAAELTRKHQTEALQADARARIDLVNSKIADFFRTKNLQAVG